ncbi:dienelactone hydrolase family protein [Actinacidiphila glaucinigra]|uniref:dienelactone hydrolase family protein n=1 Tax=Actinacidiphila glaucinigra TaxID=235986 RepID=UPI00379FAA26
MPGPWCACPGLRRLRGRTGEPLRPRGVVVLPDVRGLYRFCIEPARRFAEHGHHAVVVDYYGPIAGAGERGPDFPVDEHMVLLTPSGLYDDLSAAVAHLRSPEGGARHRIVTAGFRIGGRPAVLAGTKRAGHGLAGTVGFHCRPAPGPDGSPGPTQRAGGLTAPVLALMAGDDPGIPPEHDHAFEHALAEAGVEHEVVTGPGAPHSFFDVRQDAHAEASADAWRRVLAFAGRAAAG